jgi:CRP-like cAMP-binding protein
MQIEQSNMSGKGKGMILDRSHIINSDRIPGHFSQGPLPRMNPNNKIVDQTNCDPRLAILASDRRSQFDLEVFYEFSRTFPFFAGMTKSIHMEIISRSKLIQVPTKGTLIYRQGDEATGLFVVLQGHLGIYTEPEDIPKGFFLNYCKVEPESSVQRGERIGEMELVQTGTDDSSSLNPTPLHTSSAPTTNSSTPLPPDNEDDAISKPTASTTNTMRPQSPQHRVREFSVATTDHNVQLLFLPKLDYLQLRNLNRESLLSDVVAFLHGCAVFSHWSPEALGAIAPLFQRRNFTHQSTGATVGMGVNGGDISALAAASSKEEVGLLSSAGVIIGENLEDVDAHVLFVQSGSALLIRRSEQAGKMTSQKGMTLKQKQAKLKRKQMKKLLAETKGKELAAQAALTQINQIRGHGRTFSMLDGSNGGIMDGGTSTTGGRPAHGRRPSMMFGSGGGHSRATSMHIPLGGIPPISNSPPSSPGNSPQMTPASTVPPPPQHGRGHSRRMSVSIFQQNEMKKKAMLEAMEARRSGHKDDVESSSEEDDEHEAGEEHDADEAAEAAEEHAMDTHAQEAVDESILSEEEKLKRQATTEQQRETFVDAWIVARLTAGDMFGWSALERPQTYYTRNVFLRTAEPMRALLIARKDFEYAVLNSNVHLDMAARSRDVLTMITHLRNGLLKSSMKRSPAEIFTLASYLHVSHSRISFAIDWHSTAVSSLRIFL